MSTVRVESTSQALPTRKGLPTIAKIVLGIVGVLLLLILVMYGVGMATPADHLITRSLDLNVDKQAVYDAIVDWEHYPDWRDELVGVSAVKDPEGDPRWLEDWQGDQDVELEMTTQEPGRRVAITIHDPSAMYSGTWEFILASADSGAMVTLTERGTIHHPMARGVMTCVPSLKGYCLTVFLTGLAKKFGEDQPRIH